MSNYKYFKSNFAYKLGTKYLWLRFFQIMLSPVFYKSFGSYKKASVWCKASSTVHNDVVVRRIGITCYGNQRTYPSYVHYGTKILQCLHFSLNPYSFCKTRASNGSRTPDTTHGGKRPVIHCGVPCGVSFHHVIHNLHVTREQLVRKTFIFNEHCKVTISSKKY